MTTAVLALDPIFKKFPTISEETRKITTALAAQESGSRLATSFLSYALACHNLIGASAPLRKAHKDLDVFLQALSTRVQAAYAKIAPSEFLTALRANDVRTIEKILKISDLQNKKLPNGEMPLQYAIRCGSPDVVKYLFEFARVNPLSKDHQGLTAFDHAYISKNKKMIAHVMGEALGTTIPESALSTRMDLAEMQLLAKDIATFRRPPVAKVRPFFAAAVLGDLKELQKLSKETDIHSADRNGLTALHYAVLGGKKDAVNWLLAKGAKLEGKTARGMNLLHLAVIGGSEAILSLLLSKKKWDLNDADGQGRTPLHFALGADQLAIAKILIERGGDPLVKTMQTTPFAILNYVSRFKAELRDPLKLDIAPLLILGSFAVSAACHYFGKADGGDFRKYLPLAGKVLGALPVIGTLYAKSESGSVVQRMATRMAVLPAIIGYLSDDRSAKSFFEGVHTLSLGKTWIDNLRISWKNSSVETYRPLRNAFIHSANALFSAWEFLNTTGYKKRMVCQLASYRTCLRQKELDPRYYKQPKCGSDPYVKVTQEDLVKICNREYPGEPLTDSIPSD